MHPIDRKVQTQWQRFVDELPTLLSRHPNAWVAYLDGVQHVAATEGASYDWALEHLGIDAGFVVAQVAEVRPVLLRAAGAFRVP